MPSTASSRARRAHLGIGHHVGVRHRGTAALRGEVEGLHAEIGRLRAELAATEARLGRLGDRTRAARPAGSAGEVVRRVRAAVARRYHPDAVRGDPLARLVRQEVFKEMQQLLEEVEAGLDRE